MSSVVNHLWGWYEIVWQSLTHKLFFRPRGNLPAQLVKPVSYIPYFTDVIYTFY